MFTYYFQGLALGAAMILPLGPQNAFVMNQGIRRQYHLMIALLCAVSDLLLICAGIFGGSALLMQSPWLLALVTWGGVAFLLWYGFGALKTALSSQPDMTSADALRQGRWRIIATMLAVTWLNPHVYLDTFVFYDRGVFSVVHEVVCCSFFPSIKTRLVFPLVVLATKHNGVLVPYQLLSALEVIQAQRCFKFVNGDTGVPDVERATWFQRFT